MAGGAPIQLTILRRGDLNIVDVAAVGSLIPRSETHVDAAFLAEIAAEVARLGAEDPERRARDLVRVGGLIFSHLLTEPARRRLRAAAPADLHLRLDEELVHVPWELCHDGVAFLAARFRVGRRVITARAIPEASAERAPGGPLRVLVVGRAGEQLCERLAGVSGLHVTRLANAGHAALLGALADCDVVHFVGSVRYDAATPGRSGWCLDDGVLTADDLGALRPAPLLVFSQAVGDGADRDAHAGAVGAAFLLAGIRSCVASLWTLDGDEAVRFASACHGALGGGATLGEALSHARRAARERGVSHLLYGDPTFAPLGTGAAPPKPAVDVEATTVVGRDEQLARLRAALDTARSGTRAIVLVSGPAGIGKTALTDVFLDGVRDAADVWIARGQSIEQYGSGEAYLPVLEALTNLGRTTGAAYLAELMRRHAPSWLPQLPALVADADRQPRALGTTRDRMMREMGELIEAIGGERPLVLVLEDLHWSDRSTLELVTYVAERRDPARIMLIGTHRPVATLPREHPLRTMAQELVTRRRADELRLEPLAADGIAAYLRARLGGAVDDALPAQVRRRTEGHPLFVVTLVDWVLREGLLREAGGRWALSGGAAALDVSTPESLRQVIERQIEALDPAEGRVLEAASLVGSEFSVAAAAAAMGTSPDEIDERCEALAERGQLLVAAGVEEWPDGTVAGRYRFGHALHTDVLAGRVGDARRVRMHRRVAERKEAAFGPRAAEIASELAARFTAAGDPVRALGYHVLAGDNAIRRNADHEAVQHLTRARRLLDGLPDRAQRAEQELALLVKLVTPLMAIGGYASREVEGVFERAHALSRQVAEGPYVYPLLRALVAFHQVRGQSPTARIVGDELLARCEGTSDDLAHVQAHYGHGVTLYDLVELNAARSHLDYALARYDPATHAQHVATYGGYDPGVACHSWLSLIDWLQGRPDRAFEHSAAGVALGTSLGHPHSLCRAHLAAANLHLFRRDPRVVREHVTAARGIAQAEGFAFLAVVADAMEGGALLFEGRLAEAVTCLTEALEGFRAAAAGMSRPIFLGMLGIATALMGDFEEGLRQIDLALAKAEETQQRLHPVTLYRFRGQVLLGTGDMAHAEACLRQSMTLAADIGAKMLELQAANSLASLWHASGRGDEARALIAPRLASFAEGLDSPDLDEARALLALP